MKRLRNLPSLELLKGFEAAARHLSFTRAAGDLHLTQSAVSRQIKLLEKQLETPLFVRGTRALALTAAGERYFETVRECLGRLRDATEEIRQSTSHQPVRVTTSVPIASLWLVPNLAQFQEQHPGIAVHVVANNAFNDLNRDGLDLAVRYCTREAAGPDALKLFGETITPVCSPRLLKKTPITSPSDLTRVPLLHFVDLEQRVAWISWDAWFHAAKLHPLKSKGHPQFSLYDQTIAAAVAGQGVALGRQPLINHLIQAGKLVTPFPSRRYRMTSNGRAYWLLTSNRARERKAVQQFTSWLTQV